MSLLRIESIVLFVADIDAAAKWYADLFRTRVQHENERYAFIEAGSVLVGFHPLDAKCPGGAGGTTAYWVVDDVDATVADLQSRGACLHRGPGATSLGARVAMLIDPFGCTLGLHQAPRDA